jgi:hypothetical protein
MSRLNSVTLVTVPLLVQALVAPIVAFPFFVIHLFLKIIGSDFSAMA